MYIKSRSHSDPWAVSWNTNHVYIYKATGVTFVIRNSSSPQYIHVYIGLMQSSSRCGHQNDAHDHDIINSMKSVIPTNKCLKVVRVYANAGSTAHCVIAIIGHLHNAIALYF